MITLPQISAPTPNLNHDKEAELLICLAQTKISQETASKIEMLLQQEIDWNYLLKIAFWHKVQPLLYLNLKNTCPDQVPAKILKCLQTECQRITLNNLFLSHRLISILKFLESNGIRAIAFKGPILATSAYGNLSLRRFGDLDILVEKQDVPEVIELLKTQKYQPQEYLTAARNELQEVFGECSLVSDDGRVFIDLHWELTPTYFPYKPKFNQLWERLEPISLAGNTVRQLSLEDSLLYLCVHGCKDLWQSLSWICDIAELIKAYPQIQWSTLWEEAKKQNCERMLLLGLTLAQDIQGITLPDEVKQRINASAIIPKLAAEVKERLFQQIDAPLDVFERSFWSWRLTFHFRLIENIKYKILLCLFVVQFALTPKDNDYEALPLPNWLASLYFLIRPIRLVIKFGLTPLQRGLEWGVALFSDRKSLPS
ncbi:nucleotidyltransferase domain-containing protein [Anabaena sp. CA = ATCC 33047]|uniref:nucleotidyltransferase domain-containing protein n=1 Tax=Anabaena sp. (strain CA / ATCC 33047) TaxID=52271 RepID=UPI000832D7B9|nr:nucleotidyltransferase family protein [Anabaena sp. CA = ATCC 33047]